MFELFLNFFAGDFVGKNLKKASSESGNGYKKTSEKFRRLLLSFYWVFKSLYSCPNFVGNHERVLGTFRQENRLQLCGHKNDS